MSKKLWIKNLNYVKYAFIPNAAHWLALLTSSSVPARPAEPGAGRRVSLAMVQRAAC